VSNSETNGMPGSEACFLGVYEHSLDPQRRLAIPSLWRNPGENRFVLLPGRNKILQLIPYASFRENFLAKASKVSFANAGGSQALALLGSRAVDCICDKQGRIQMPQKLIDYAEIKDAATLVGSVTTIQLWAQDRWAQNQVPDESYFDEVQRISESPDDFFEMLCGSWQKT